MTELSIDIRDNKRRQLAMQSAHNIFSIVRKYVPDHCKRDMLDDLTATFYDMSLELTSIAQREQYDAVLKLCADGAKYEEILKAVRPR